MSAHAAEAAQGEEEGGEVSLEGGAELDGPGRYVLRGFVSHIGRNTGCGHYVAHVKKHGRWIKYDDSQVSASQHPPLGLGYLYLYERLP